MKRTLTTSEIANELFSDEYAGWSYAGAHALAEWLEEMEEGSGTESEFDRVAIRCDFGEWESLDEWACDYFGGEAKMLSHFDWGESYAGNRDEYDQRLLDDSIREYINDNGFLIKFSGGVIVSSF